MNQPQPFLELVIQNARIVQGHPMETHQREKDGVKQFLDDGVTPSMENYFAIAVPKGAEAAQGPEGWKATAWGQQIVARAMQDWPNGEYGYGGFAWKVEDGDSQVPNKNGKKNVDREGFPGNWIIKGTTGLGVKCWDGLNPVGAMREILDKNAIKTGDYVSVAYHIRGNSPSPSKGMYVNPTNVMLVRAGAQIMGAGSGSDAASLFGRETASLAGNAAPGMQAPAMAPAPTGYMAPPAAAPAMVPAAVQPYNDFLNVGTAGDPSTTPPPASAIAPAPAPAPAIAPVAAPPVEASYIVNGAAYTESSLRGAGYTDAHFATLPRA